MRQPDFATATGISLDAAEAVNSVRSEPVPRAHFGPRLWWLTRLLVPTLCVAILLYAQFAERLASVPGAPPLSVAVLPFVDMSGDHARQFLADGIASELLVRLAGEPGLKVLSRTASFAAATRAQDLRSIGRALNADRMLEGSIRTAGKRLRVSVQITDAHSGSGLWSKAYDREAGDSLALQDELALAIATDVAAELGAPSPTMTGVSSP
jgi:TolB-like protein